jgi:hypothetical protein
MRAQKFDELYSVPALGLQEQLGFDISFAAMGNSRSNRPSASIGE